MLDNVHCQEKRERFPALAKRIKFCLDAHTNAAFSLHRRRSCKGSRKYLDSDDIFCTAVLFSRVSAVVFGVVMIALTVVADHVAGLLEVT